LDRRFSVAVIGGDGIGPEVVATAIPIIEAAAGRHGAAMVWEHLPHGASHYLDTGETLSDNVYEHLRDDVDAIFLGALGDPRVPGNEHARDILLGLRFRLDLYINFRPCPLLHPDLCPLKGRKVGQSDRLGKGEGPSVLPTVRLSDGEPEGRDIDFVIFRENTEGSYLGRGSSTNVGEPDEEHIVEGVHSAPKVERILRAAFEWAAANGKRRVTMSDKANAIPAHRIWGRLLEKVSSEFPQIDSEHRYVDALAMELVRDPERFDVIVTNNLFGDILSDLGAELVGGLGLAASANLHPGRAGLFEPVHGSAPGLAGTGEANPMAAILTGALMLDQLGIEPAADRVREAVAAALAEGATTPDLGGTATTEEVGSWIARHVSGNPPVRSALSG
jgi:3-isopropylmalate dehydrogenase